jgi:hypothetical protein
MPAKRSRNLLFLLERVLKFALGTFNKLRETRNPRGTYLR